MIKLQNISKIFGSNQVLKDITLEIKSGEIFGLIGKNGAGKTTLISIIAGLSNATDGFCYVKEKLIETNKRSTKIGYLPDVPAFFEFMTVGEFLDFLYKCEVNYKQKKEDLLKLVGLNAKTVIKTMSRGMRQRLGLAAALVNDPDVILLDEPSSALDPMGRYELSQILLQLKKQGKVIVLSTHILTDMENICDRVGFLHNGIITKIVSPKDISEFHTIKINFEKPVDIHCFNKISLDFIADGDNNIIISGGLKDLEKQKELLKTIISINNPIIHIDAVGVDLDAIFREV